MRHSYLDCDCNSPDHLVRITLTTWADEDPEFMILPMLNPEHTFFRRLLVAIRYLFGLAPSNSWWGSSAFTEVLVSDESMLQLTTMVSHRNLIVKLRALKKKRDTK